MKYFPDHQFEWKVLTRAPKYTRKRKFLFLYFFNFTNFKLSTNIVSVSYFSITFFTNICIIIIFTIVIATTDGSGGTPSHFPLSKWWFLSILYLKVFLQPLLGQLFKDILWLKTEKKGLKEIKNWVLLWIFCGIMYLTNMSLIALYF